MKICFMGLGSIGTRHLRNLTTLLKKRGINYEIDALRSSARKLNADVAALLHQQYADIAELPDNYDIAFICTPTASHYADVKKMICHTRHMFIEKPAFSNPCELDALGLRNGVYYVACPLRYNAVLQYIKAHLVDSPVYSARALCSTYLPNWRPDVDYRTIYSAHRNMGGGVDIDLIHEWDYICWLFGMPERVLAAKGQCSNLELDSDDLAAYIGTYSNKLIELHLDYFGRNERREIELYTRDDTIIGDIRNGCVRFLKQNRMIDLREERDNYQTRELEHFFNIIDGKISNDNSLTHAVDVLRIAKGEWSR